MIFLLSLCDGKAIRYNGTRLDRYMTLCDCKAIRYNGTKLDRYVTVTVSTVPNGKYFGQQRPPPPSGGGDDLGPLKKQGRNREATLYIFFHN